MRPPTIAAVNSTSYPALAIAAWVFAFAFCSPGCAGKKQRASLPPPASAASNDVGTEFIANATAPTWSTGSIIRLGLLLRAEAQAVGVAADRSGNQIGGLLIPGASPSIGAPQSVRLQFRTATNGNIRLTGGGYTGGFLRSGQVMEIDSITITNLGAGTPSVSIGSTSGGVDYVAATVIAAGASASPSLVSRVTATDTIWIGSTTTDELLICVNGRVIR